MDYNRKSTEKSETLSQEKGRVRVTRTVQASKASLHQSGIPSSLKDQLSSTDKLTIRPEDSIKFTSSALLPGLVDSVKDLIGKDARPTPIQALSLAHFATSPEEERKRRRTRETLLASETGSGKSLAYLLPVIQGLKATEGASVTEGASTGPKTPNPNLVSGPRAIILCPTHELSRQITTYAKSLCHNVKLRIVCASNPNARGGSSKSGNWDASISPEGLIPGFGGRAVDILIGTPPTILSLIGGKELGDRKAISAVRRLDQEGEEEVGARMSLERLEWLVIDEADVMFDRSFIETTQAILEDAATQNRQAETSHLQANLILSSATIPLSLSKYLDAHFPRIVRLASPRVHRLPKLLKTEYVQLTDGNKNATISKKIEAVWAEDAQDRQAGRSTHKSKIVIFANETKVARRLADYLKQKGVESLVLVGDAEERRKGSNQHLAGFLSPAAMPSTTRATQEGPDASSGPRILITTSLLSRGLDFDPSIRHVFVADEPRSAVDFIHRAGRTGRAGNVGTVVLFEKGSRGDRRREGKIVRLERFGKVSKRRR
ncbi:hypothetical protein M407DRAFT_209840 [Tulasnella calospora MUT 4182]|uniref:ATP-dependent RNA helicase n=1 Tax=Tulasnella calospora MUT 4182 TaxID=1051891 RepID=A0A0C3LKE3_9AGAM|nr:hypothetical protein M407DRAFT_209840 [Tulasnella calospora MUT 4182]